MCLSLKISKMIQNDWCWQEEIHSAVWWHHWSQQEHCSIYLPQVSCRHRTDHFQFFLIMTCWWGFVEHKSHARSLDHQPLRSKMMQQSQKQKIDLGMWRRKRKVTSYLLQLQCLLQLLKPSQCPHRWRSIGQDNSLRWFVGDFCSFLALFFLFGQQNPCYWALRSSLGKILEPRGVIRLGTCFSSGSGNNVRTTRCLLGGFAFRCLRHRMCLSCCAGRNQFPMHFAEWNKKNNFDFIELVHGLARCKTQR